MISNKGGATNPIRRFGGKFLLDIIFPKECLGCGVEGHLLCERCLSGIEYYKHGTCIKCGKEVNEGILCKHCSNVSDLQNILVIGDYNDKMWRDSIKYLKYYFIRELARDLAELIDDYIKRELSPNSFVNKILSSRDTLLIAAPLHKKRKRWRGFNQSEEIARKLSHQYDLPLSSDLIKIKNKKPQTKLSGRERKENLRDCFFWRGGDLSGYNIILVDDVITTGTTIFECAAALKTNGAKNILGLAVARG